MRTISTEDVVKITGGKLITGQSADIIGVCQDSRLAKPGFLFVAIKGDAFDGHDFIVNAIESGCSGVIADDDAKIKTFLKTEVIKNDKRAKVPLIKVQDSQRALQALAKNYIDSLSLKKIAVTGSTGKTTTRDMIYYIMSEKLRTVKNEGNFNTTVGVPLTIMTLEPDTQAAVIEMGMDRPGEIDIMARIVRPSVAAVTNIGVSHLERLGTRQAIFDAKMEITNYFSEEDILVICEDDEFLNKENIRKNIDKNFNIITVGEKNSCDYLVKNIAADDNGNISFDLSYQLDGKDTKQTENIKLPVAGRHNALNAALAIATARQFGVSINEAKRGLAKLQITGKRLNIQEKNGIKIIDDTYNASPDSMRAALRTLAGINAKRHIAILGDMFELGENEREFHSRIGDIARENADIVYSVGELAQNISKENNFKTTEEIVEALNEGRISFKKGDVVLVKASRGMKLERVVLEILQNIERER